MYGTEGIWRKSQHLKGVLERMGGLGSIWEAGDAESVADPSDPDRRAGLAVDRPAQLAPAGGQSLGILARASERDGVLS